MEEECRFKADNSMGHTETCEDDTTFQVEKEFRASVQPRSIFLTIPQPTALLRI